MLRCPVCGSEVNPIYLKTYAEKQMVLVNGEEVTQFKCQHCGTFMSPVELKHDFQYYWDKAEKIYGSRWRDNLVILDEIKEYGLFDKEKNEQAEFERSKRVQKMIEREQQNEKSINSPKCPTCGSKNITKISAVSKVAGAVTFGLFSKTAKSQFKCNNCGYKW